MILNTGSGRYFLIYLWIFFSFLTTSESLHADVVTDGSVGSAQTLKGPDYAIPETLGTVKGQNLFHSFKKFNIQKEESATFTGPDSIQNVISRVTGGDSSTIDGTLRSEVGKADFYFINPNGVVFGPNAKVDVPASFHVSTSDELKFADGSSFKASKPETSTLTQAAPESFGFLGAQSASIEINGSTLLFAPESKVSLNSSKDITIKGTEDIDTGIVNSASLVSKSGKIVLEANGDLVMDAAKVDTSGNGSGEISVKANSVKIINNSTIASDNTGEISTDGGGIEIVADSNLELAQGSRIQSNVSGSGDSGTISIKADNLLIKQQEGEGLTGVLIEVEPVATGNGKTIDVNVKHSLKIEGVAGIASSTSGFGDAASVNVTAGQLQMDGQGRDLLYRDTNYAAGIVSNALEDSYGNTNDVSIYVDTLLEMSGGCRISSYSSGMGDGSNVSIKAGEMKVDGSTANNYLTIIATSSASEGKSVKTDIEVDGQLELLCGAQIYSETSLNGDAGEVCITAGDLIIDNKGFNEKYTGVWSDTYLGSGNAGKINIAVTDLMELLNGANISSSTYSEGNAGDITITAGELKIDHQGLNNQNTGVWSNAYSGSKGNSGNVDIAVSGMMELLNGAKISSSAWSEGDAGEISITAKNFEIDNQGLEYQYTGIWSDTYYGSKGNAGTIDIKVEEMLELLDGANISSSTYSEGNAGEVAITAGDFRIDHQGINNQDTGIWSIARYGATGKAGKVGITVSGLLELLNGAKISSSTASSEDAGEISITAKDCKIDNQSLDNQQTGIWSDTYSTSTGKAGEVDIKVSGSLELLNGAKISSETYSDGDAGKVEIALSGDLNIENNSRISSSTFSQGKGGNIIVDAENIKIDNQGIVGFTGIWSDANIGSQGNAGTVDINVSNQLELLNGAQISSATYSQGNSGNVFIDAENIKIDNQGAPGFTGIWSDAEPESQGNAGIVEVKVLNQLELLNGAQISSATYGDGNGGNVLIDAANLIIDTQDFSGFTGIWSHAGRSSQGNAGTVDINVSNQLELLNGAQISSTTYSQGNAGTVNISVTGLLEIINGSHISSDTYSYGNGNKVQINAGTIRIDDQGNDGKYTGIWSDAEPDSQGNAGIVEVKVLNQLELLNGAQISSSTYSIGNGGNILINAENIIINHNGISDENSWTGIWNDSVGQGNAGTVQINVFNQLELLNGAQISSDAYLEGNAGNVIIDANNLLMNNAGYIGSAAYFNATGYVGNVNIATQSIKMLDESSISISGFQTLAEDQLINIPEKSITMTAKDFLIEKSYISSMSTQNVPASLIQLKAENLIISNNSRIRSDANMADGGDINIEGKNISLNESLITTSVKGEHGDGGDISINKNYPGQTLSDSFLIMQGGFIQANTAGKGNSGGEIDINVKGVIADKTQELNIGGKERQQFDPDNPNKNVIQSAAEDGYPGEINITGLQLDISGSIMNMTAQFSDEIELATDLCQNMGTEKASSLINGTRGGFPEMPSDLSSIYFDRKMLDELLLYKNRN